MSSEQPPSDTQIVILGQYAGFVTRLIAWLVDYLIVAAVIGVLAILARFFLQFDGINDLLGTSQVARVIMLGIAYAVAISFLLLYYLGFWMLAGQTPGKWLMGVRIVRTDGERLLFRSALVRLLGYLLSFFLFLGYLWVLYDNRRQAWHDKLARTLVVYRGRDETALSLSDQVREYLRDRQRRTRAGDTNRLPSPEE